MDPTFSNDRVPDIPLDRTLSQLDRDVARSFLNASVPMQVARNYRSTVPFQSIDQVSLDLLPSPLSTNKERPEGHTAAPMVLPSNVNLNPALYCDVIIETVTDYDSK